jgi:hypothetical protein
MTTSSQPVRQAVAAARVLVGSLPASAPFSHAAVQLAIACLEVANAPVEWLEAHDLVRDIGVGQARKHLVDETVRAFVFATECVRMMALHGGPPSDLDGMPQRLSEFASSVGGAIGAMARIERELAERIAEPRLAELGLERRRRSLSFDPTDKIATIRRLAGEVANLEREGEGLRTRQAALVAAQPALRQELATLQGHIDRLERDNAATRNLIVDRDSAARAAESERIGLAERLRSADADLARVRGQLEALRSDPRQAVRARVQLALQVLDGGPAAGSRS